MLLAGVCIVGSASAYAAAILQTNLVSDGFVPAAHIDNNLINPWGVAYAPTSPFWISDNGTGVSTLYDGTGNPAPLVVTVAPPSGAPSGTTAAPTGQVFNIGGANDFVVSDGTKSARAVFLFATEDGTISGWSPNVDLTHSVIGPDPVPGAVYKGLAIGTVGASTFLYAANFKGGTVDVFDGNFKPVKSFTDPGVPTGYAPFNVQVLNGHLYVTFALQDADKEDDVEGAGHGYVDEFDLNGTLLNRIASNGPLNSPWGLDIAPAQFGQFSNDLLVGNFGDGRINVFDSITDAFLGQLTDLSDNPLVIGDLWALTNGNHGMHSDPNAVYFTAGIEDEAHGLFGSLKMVPEPGVVSLMALGLAGLWRVRRKKA